MRIIRTMPDEGWVPVSNAAARDHRLSWRARGLLVELLSYPDGWRTTIDDLVRLGKIADGHAEGRDAMRTAMNELVQAGYVVRSKVHDGDGQFISSFAVADDPAAHQPTEYPASVNQRLPTQRSGDQASGDQSVINKTVTNTVTKTDHQRRSNEHSSSLVSLATGAEAPPEFAINEPTLDDHYATVNRMPPPSRRKALLELERRRPKIYRECRRSAIAQTKREKPGVFREQDASVEIDRLSYQYAIQHYHPDLPQWIVKPMTDAAQARR
jgi:hypothetical protein